MQRFEWSSLQENERGAVLVRPQRRRDPDITKLVAQIFADVEQGGAEAVRRWSLAIDQREPRWLELAPPVVDAARALLEREDIDAIERAVDQVRFYHEATKPKSITVETAPGVMCRQVWRPISTCGLYAPAGTAPLVSTLIMLAEPARIAGVPNRVVATPPGADGLPHPAMVAAAALCGLDAIWLTGGAQAIAALSFGAGVPKADKIFGPGNAYVAEAKRLAASLVGGPAIDLPAGPSELMIIADVSADPTLVAADLLAQAEHDSDAQVLFVSTSNELIEAVEAELATQLEALPRREIARAALAQARFIRVTGYEAAIDVANLYAPEHLSLQTLRPCSLVESIQNAGAIFVGHASAESFGDYLAGQSHVLPTDGAACAFAGVSVASFMKSLSVQELSEEGVRGLARATARLARLEGLDAHARAAELRAKSVREPGQEDFAPVVRRRRAEVVRETKETSIVVEVDLDRAGQVRVETGVGFFDHMIEQIAVHGGFSLALSCDGDLQVDAHHSIEDCALALGQAIKQALGDRAGIGRFGFVLPMDEAEARISIDLGGRPYSVFNGAFNAPVIGEYPTQMTAHVFASLSQAMGAAIHVAVTGENDHHKTEACFKALGRALRQAIRIEDEAIPSTKGMLA